MKKAALAVLLLAQHFASLDVDLRKVQEQALQLYRQPRPLFQHQPLR